MKKKHAFTASKLRIILSASLFLTSGLTVALFYFGREQLATTATSVSHAVADSNASQDNIASLKKLEQELNNNQDVMERTTKITADSQGYNYQNQIITDLYDHANKAGLEIDTIDFKSASTATQTGDTSTATPPAGTTETPDAGGTPAGLKPVNVTLTLRNPVGYENLLRFIRSLEQNLTKMQIAQVGLTKATDGDAVTTEALTIELYVR
jgi:TolA-binding protein